MPGCTWDIWVPGNDFSSPFGLCDPFDLFDAFGKTFKRAFVALKPHLAQYRASGGTFALHRGQ